MSQLIYMLCFRVSPLNVNPSALTFIKLQCKVLLVRLDDDCSYQQLVFLIKNPDEDATKFPGFRF